jgi:hypothetical protein
MALDIHPRARAHLGDHGTPLFITEGSKKVDSLISAGAKAVVGLVGVWSWRGTNRQNGKTLLPDWGMGRPAGPPSVRRLRLGRDAQGAGPASHGRLGAVLNRHGANAAFVCSCSEVMSGVRSPSSSNPWS